MNWGHPERGKVLLLAGDFVLAAAAVILATIFYSETFTSPSQRAGLIAVFALVYSVCFYVFDLYDMQTLNGPRTATRLVAATTLGTSILSLFLYLLDWWEFTRVSMSISVLLLIVSSFGWRWLYKKQRASWFKKRNILMVGTADDALNLHAILESADSPYELCGFFRLEAPSVTAGTRELSGNSPSLVEAAGLYASRGGIAVEETARLDVAPADIQEVREGCRVTDLGGVNPSKLENLTRHFHADTIVIRQNSAAAKLAESLTRLRFRGVRISTMPDLCSEILEELPLDTLSDMWFSFATGFDLLHERVFRRVKRLADILMAFAGLLVTLPISLLVALAIKLESPGPVLFTQWRVGRMEKPFTLLKFRSMREGAEPGGKPQWAAAQDSRATRVGRILRRLHLDEIPQMINVLLGEMSFIGPRPERPIFVEQLKQLVPFYSLRHHLPPGITGWAQVNYPYGASVEDARRKLQYDLFYVRNASPTLDLRILLRTARVILFRRGSR